MIRRIFAVCLGFRRVLRPLARGLLGFCFAHTCAQATPLGLPAPKELISCAQGDPVAAVEASVATKQGGKLLGCFVSEKRIMVQGTTKAVPVSLEHAFAIGISGGPFTSTDLDKLLSTVTDQWKGFDPLSKEFENYTDRINALIKEAGTNPTATVSSIKPVLVSIDRLDAKSYWVVSIRSYILYLSREHVNATRVNGDAVVLRGSELVRLTMQRTLTDPSDVAMLQGDIAEWAREIAASPSAPDQDTSGSSQRPQ
jgi:hypothetical protein